MENNFSDRVFAELSSNIDVDDPCFGFDTFNVDELLNRNMERKARSVVGKAPKINSQKNSVIISNEEINIEMIDKTGDLEITIKSDFPYYLTRKEQERVFEKIMTTCHNYQ